METSKGIDTLIQMIKSKFEFYKARPESHSWVGALSEVISSIEFEVQKDAEPEPVMYSNPLLLKQEQRSEFRRLKDEWICKELRLREDMFCSRQLFTVLTCTWNVAGKMCDSLQTLFPLPKENGPDIVTIGFQEIELSAEAFLYAERSREQEWINLASQSLKAFYNEPYIKVASKCLVGMLIVVFSKEIHTACIRHVCTSSAGCGVMGVLGNKGGVSVRFRFYDSYLCFVNSHLAADTSQVVRRNQDFQEITKRLSFEYKKERSIDVFSYYYFTGSQVKNESDMNAANSDDEYKFKITDADYTIWAGDLNYRIPMSESEVKEYIRLMQCRHLLLNDQLYLEKKAGRVFQGYTEGEILFEPTYKFDIGTNVYDTSEKRRTPSYCDRILWINKEGINQKYYRSHPEFKSSDHKPVSAMFNISVKLINKKSYDSTFQEVIRELDKFENECLPDLSISTNVIDYDNVYYMQPKSFVVIAQYRIIPKLEEKAFCKPWMYINPSMGMLLPKEKSSIMFTVLVNQNSAPALNSGQDRLEDIVILHVESGKDFFMSVSGKFMKTCFCNPLVDLIDNVAPIRQAESEKIAKSPESRILVPKELWRMVEYIRTYGMQTADIFSSSGDPSVMDYIRECLDTGTELSFPSKM